MINFMQRYEALFDRLAELHDLIAEQEETVEMCKRAVGFADANVEAAEAQLVQSVQGSNAEQRKANLVLAKQNSQRYRKAEDDRREDQTALATALIEQRRLENQFRAVCYQALLTAAFAQMDGLKLPAAPNGHARLEESVDALGL